MAGQVHIKNDLNFLFPSKFCLKDSFTKNEVFLYLQQLKQLVTYTQKCLTFKNAPLHSSLLSPLPLPSFSLSFSHIKIFWPFILKRE